MVERTLTSPKENRMSKDYVAQASVTIQAQADKVWSALTDPAVIRQYMFGTHVISDWKKGSPIIWRGEWEGKAYEDRGLVLTYERNRRLRYSHYSPVAGEIEMPGMYHTVTIELSEKRGRTVVSLMQDNNATRQAKSESEKNWTTMLAGLKQLMESRS